MSIFPSCGQGRRRREGRGSHDPRTFKNRGGRPPQKLRYFSIFFLETQTHFFAFSNIFKIKWPKFEEKLDLGGRWVWVPMSPTPPNRNFVATPLAVVFIGQKDMGMGQKDPLITLQRAMQRT